MEESSDAHMETDVSSTTEDVPEAQEVTNSNGNKGDNELVEMVVIVEKVSEDENNASQQSDSQPKVGDTVASKILSPSISPKKSPLKASKSPSKTPETQRSPNKPEQTQSPKKGTSAETATLAPSQCEQMVDSSTKIESCSLLKSNNTTPVKTNPALVEPENVTISPNKEQNNSSKSSPSKETEVQSTIPTSKKDEQSENPNLDEKVNDVTETESKEADIMSIKSVLSYPTPYIGEKEISNDSQIDTSSDVSDKEHNKSISRELKSLINSAKESKIISECTQLTSKTRKSRAPLDTSNTSVNTVVEPEKIQDKRRNSNNSQQSNCSEKSDKTTVKRSMRSQNPEFVNKVKQFLNSVTSKVQKVSDEGTDVEVIEDIKTKEVKNESSPLPKRKKVAEPVVQDKSAKLRSDPYCWRCHWAIEQAPNEKVHPPMTCTVCPRSYHYKCLSGAERTKINTEKNWVCPECMTVLHAESSETRSPTMKKINLGMLCELLKHAIGRMMDLNGVEPFMHPVDRTMFPDYEKYVVHPMDLSLMQQNISAGLYGSTEAFLADAQWILHNSIIFNTLQSKLTAAARTLVRSCRAEMGEIEACPECYAAAHAHKPTWFTDVCTTPHVLLWAKLKGFPYWPAKGMSVNGSGLVDVRFFGAHDRAWVPAKDCFLYSEKDPNNFRTKRQDILESMREAEQHIRNISRKYGKFVYPPFKTQFDPSKLNEQLKLMIPSFEGELRSHVKKPTTDSPNMMKEKRRSNSKSSKGSHNDGDTSEGEEASSVTSRKMADGAVIARVEDESMCEKDKTTEVDSPAPPKEETSKTENRKRRRSDLEEAVITIIETSKEKKKRVEDEKDKSDSKVESHTISSTNISQDAVIILDDKNTEPKTKAILNDKNDQPKTKDNEPSSSTPVKEKTQTLAPIKLVISTKSNKPVVVSKQKVKVKSTTVSPLKFKEIKFNSSHSLLKEQFKQDKTKKRRRSSKSNKHLNNSDPGTKANKHEKKTDKTDNSTKEKAKEHEKSAKAKDDLNKSAPERTLRTADGSKSVKERLQFDDDTSLAVLAREAKNSVTNSNITGMPTISSVRSLSTTAQNSNTTSTKTTTTPKSIEISIEPNSNVTITPSNTENVRNVSEAANKTPKAKTGGEPSLIGKVGVRAFARMTSPEKPKDNSNSMQVEIKTEPLDLDDPDRHMEKMDLMNAFKLRPVNPVNLREVRINKINKVIVTSAPAKKGVGKVECRPRAKKTFPQPRKPDDGRSELNGKNSMVYIPIQPPVTPVPVRGTRLANVSVSDGTTVAKSTAVTSASNSVVNTVSTPLINCIVSTNANAIVTSSTSTSTIIAVPSVAQTPIIGQGPNIGLAPCVNQVSNVGQGPIVSQGSNVGQISAVGHIPTTVHTVPLITSVNGQWTFSLQPIMSVGVDTENTSQPMVNGLPDRNSAGSLISSTSTGPAGLTGPVNPVIVPAAPLIVPVSAPASASATTTGLVPSSTVSTAPNSILSSVSVINPNRMAEATVTPGEPPRLMQRPPLHNPFDPRAPTSTVPVPTSAGPLTAKLNQNSVKLMDFFRTLLEDSLELIDEPAAQLASLKLQLEQIRWKHRQTLDELKHNHDLTVAEMRSAFEKEKVRIINELRSAAQVELDAAIKLAKSKQWCANCRQEAQFYCCWNTSYCDYPCQRSHWSQHFAVCTQQRAQDGDGSVDCLSTPPESRLQPQPDHAKNVAPMTTPNLTVGGKDANRGDQTQKGSSFIMSMEKDTSGNSTMKCVGTYKAPNIAPAQMPIIINKQVLNNDDNTKKVVTSGGYLIVGAANSTAPMVGTRRPATIQYYT